MRGGGGPGGKRTRRGGGEDRRGQGNYSSGVRITTYPPECSTDEDALASTLEAIAQLPPANKDTLAFLILHIQRVAAHCDTNKMPLASLAKIFGPAVVGHASPNPKDDVILADTKKQPVVMMRLLGISADYWKQYMSESDNPEPPVTSPTPSVRSSPGLRSPATPELRPGQQNPRVFCIAFDMTSPSHPTPFLFLPAVPESPYLGSCQSPKSKSFRSQLLPRYVHVYHSNGRFMAPVPYGKYA